MKLGRLNPADGIVQAVALVHSGAGGITATGLLCVTHAGVIPVGTGTGVIATIAHE